MIPADLAKIIALEIVEAQTNPGLVAEERMAAVWHLERVMDAVRRAEVRANSMHPLDIANSFMPRRAK